MKKKKQWHLIDSPLSGGSPNWIPLFFLLPAIAQRATAGFAPNITDSNPPSLKLRRAREKCILTTKK